MVSLWPLDTSSNEVEMKGSVHVFSLILFCRISLTRFKKIVQQVVHKGQFDTLPQRSQMREH